MNIGNLQRSSRARSDDRPIFLDTELSDRRRQALRAASELELADMLRYRAVVRETSGVGLMQVDRKWVERNLGFDPIDMPPPASTFAFSRAAQTSDPEDLQREIIDFDSESPAGLQFLAFTTATGLSRYIDVPWPAGLAPKTGPRPRGSGDSPLPRADVLVVTWTVDEGHALSRVLTPGKDSHNDYVSYTHNFAAIAKKMRHGCPALQAKRLGAFWTTTIGGKMVVIFKSDSHMSQDGPQLPNIDVWRQIINRGAAQAGDHHRHRRRHRQAVRGRRRDRQPDRALRLHG